jgi:hypothetical protein
MINPANPTATVLIAQLWRNFFNFGDIEIADRR